MKKLSILLLLFLLTGICYGQGTPGGRGLVRDSTGRPLRGANVSLLGTRFVTATDSTGQFRLTAPAGKYRLRVTYIGYAPIERAIDWPLQQALTLVLQNGTGQLGEVVVSTGYQELPKERATGSFVAVDKALLNRSVGTDIVGRLRDVVPGLVFNSLGTRISIRGQSTLFSNAAPLIVVDGFPYNQPIENLNPNDVASITVLKDAAAASIWGARAGNGVVVITTNKGAYNRPLRVSFNANVNIGARPDLFYQPRMSSADYIGLEQRLFSEGYFNGAEHPFAGHPPLSPVAELLIANRDGQLGAAELQSRLDGLKAQDVRKDLDRYFYRPSVNQQYALSLDGGSAGHRYLFSGGYDRNLDNAVGTGYNRLTLNAVNTWTTWKNKLEISAAIYLTQTQSSSADFSRLTWNNGDLLYPYAALADGSGTPLAITGNYRQSFVDAAPAAGLLDWQYRPLEELRLADNRRQETDVRLNTGLKYNLLPGLNLQLLYMYDQNRSSGRNLRGQGSYYTRNLINQYTQDDGSGMLSRPVPSGGILDLTSGNTVNHDGRAQLNYSATLGARHELNALAGYEVQSLQVLQNEHRAYGYDAEHATLQQVDGRTIFGFYDNPNSSSTIPLNLSENDATDHYLSYYANAAYTYDRRFSLSGSARLDRSNLFGVNTNQKGVPLWSAGLAWELSRERFYGFSALPYLKLRATFGYNGNINKNLSAYTTARYFDAAGTSSQLPYAQIINPPNPGLRWERNRHINFGLDFGTRGGRISGTLEYYIKRGIDLIGNTAYTPSSGVTVFTGNTANTEGQGLDFNVDTRNLTGAFKWSTAFFFSYVTDKVARYEQRSLPADYLEFGYLGAYALEGKPLYAIYSYPSAGLDPQTGDPRGYLNGQPSSYYTALQAAATPENLRYHGNSRPVVFGAFRNTFSYRALSLSANISYRLGYYFRRGSVFYGSDYGLSQQHGDYAARWQQPGDEQRTVVPALPLVTNIQRDQFYRFSSDLVEKGDHIRLQDVNLTYTLRQGHLQMYVYAANLGILWRANKAGLDPDAGNNYPAPRTIAGGIRLTY